MSEMKQRAEQGREKKAAFGPDVNLAEFSRQGGAWEYDPDYRQFSPEERNRLLTTGIELTDEDHAGTFLRPTGPSSTARPGSPAWKSCPSPRP